MYYSNKLYFQPENAFALPNPVRRRSGVGAAQIANVMWIPASVMGVNWNATARVRI